MNPKNKVASASKPTPKKGATIKKKPSVKKPTPKKVVAPKKKAVVRKIAPKKAAAKKVVASRKKVAVKKPAPRKAALLKGKPLSKKPASVKKALATKSKLQKTAPMKKMQNRAVSLNKAVIHKPETKAPVRVVTEWIGTSAMKAISCPDCGAKAGEMCISKESNMAIWESHPARIVAYTTSRLTSKLPLRGQQQVIGVR